MTETPDTPVMTPCGTVETRTPWGRDAYDLCVLRAIATQASVTFADLSDVGGTRVQLRSSLGRLMSRSAVTKKRKQRFAAVEGREPALARKVALWERPGGHLLRVMYAPWRSQLPPRQVCHLDGFIERKLRVLVEWVENHVKGPLATKTAAGQERMDKRVLRALALRPGATVRDLHPFTGGLYVQVRESLHRLVATQRRVVWRGEGYWIAQRGEELGYVGLEGARGRVELDRLVLEAVLAAPEGATEKELWVRVPGSRTRLRASLARLLHRKAVRWTMVSGVTRFFPVSEETAP